MFSVRFFECNTYFKKFHPVNTVTGPDRKKSGFFSPRPDRTICVRSPVSRPDLTKFYGPDRSGTVDNYGSHKRRDGEEGKDGEEGEEG